MAVESEEERLSNRSDTTVHNKYRIAKSTLAAAALLAIDGLLVSLIIAYVPYTKIDWDAYMSQVSGFLEGERDYRNLKGDTGPLVYPAGFLYLYSVIQFITGGEVYSAQILFGVLYIVNLGTILFIYVKTDVLPWWALSLLCLSKRVHSIFVLRLFNDCLAMTLLHTALVSFLYQRWHLGLIIFSGAVSIKMNILLYAPPLLLLMLKAMSTGRVISALAGAALVQIVLGLPFLLSYPIAYVSRAFNLGRVFIHFWSVNFKFVPEDFFVSKEFAFSLLVVHLVLLITFAHYRWCKKFYASFYNNNFFSIAIYSVLCLAFGLYRYEGGLVHFLHSKFVSMKLRGSATSYFSLDQFYNQSSNLRSLSTEHIVTTMFIGNFIGIVCSRSLHYQFYSWYFHSLPFLLWKTPFPTVLRLILFTGVEFCWNVYPSNMYSSCLLFCIHLAILVGLWAAPCEYPYLDNRSSNQNKEK